MVKLLSKKSKSVVVFSEISKEPILGPLSIHQTTKILGVSKDIVPRYLNFDRYFYSPVLLPHTCPGLTALVLFLLYKNRTRHWG